LTLANGTYWFAMVPVCTTCDGRSFNGNTDGLNGVGTQISNQQFWNSSFFGANFTNANSEGTFETFSSGVLASVPEPGSWLLLGTSILSGIVVLRRKLF
jgi:PEP-CTERM motif